METLNISIAKRDGNQLYSLYIDFETIVDQVDHDVLIDALRELAKEKIWLDKYLISCPTTSGGVMHKVFVHERVYKFNPNKEHSYAERNALIASFLLINPKGIMFVL